VAVRFLDGQRGSRQIGDSTPLAADAIVMYGVRDLWSVSERERLERSASRVVEWRDGNLRTTYWCHSTNWRNAWTRSNERDKGDKTLHVALRIIEVLGDYARAHRGANRSPSE
jgi:hypothetical protein